MLQYCALKMPAEVNPYSPNVPYEGQMSCVKDNLKIKNKNKRKIRS